MIEFLKIILNGIGIGIGIWVVITIVSFIEDYINKSGLFWRQ